MFSHHKSLIPFSLLVLLLLVCIDINFSKKANRGYRKHGGGSRKTTNPFQKKMCIPMDDTVRALRKACLLRPDNGPCRADIISWYYDAKQQKCFRFFWGGCQGNGNRFDTREQCLTYCFLNSSMPTMHVPHFCSLAFDFGTCFGQYNRWGWDRLAKTCRRRLYSGCGGNQNNFETKQECMATCLNKPNNTMQRFHQFTTCIPFTIADLQ